MNKIICDVCGTAYPETASQCPICGCAKPANANVVSDDNGAAGSHNSSYTYVKGGRFSKKNVNKRNKAAHTAPQEVKSAGRAPKDVVKQNNPVIEKPHAADPQLSAPKSNKGLVITAVILLIAVIAMVFYIAMRFFPNLLPWNNAGTEDTTPATTISTESTVETTIPQIPCESVTVSEKAVELENEGDAHLIIFDIAPADTTDTVSYTTSDPKVVTVDAEGKITAVGPGEATVTVTCGKVSAKVDVSCTFVLPTEETVPETTIAKHLTEKEFHFNREDFTMGYIGETWELFDGTFDHSLIKWTTDDKSVATIEDGIVTAQGYGYTEVHATFGDQTITCIVRVG